MKKFYTNKDNDIFILNSIIDFAYFKDRSREYVCGDYFLPEHKNNKKQRFLFMQLLKN